MRPIQLARELSQGWLPGLAESKPMNRAAKPRAASTVMSTVWRGA